MFSRKRSGLVDLRHMPEFMPQKCKGHDNGNKIGYRLSIHDSVKTHDHRKENKERDKKDDLLCKRQYRTFGRFTDRREECCRTYLDAVDEIEEKVSPHEPYCVDKIDRLLILAEEHEDLLREDLESEPADDRDDHGSDHKELNGLSDPSELTRAVVITADRLGTVYKSYDERYEDNIDLRP